MTLKLNGSSSGSVSIDAPAATTSGADITFALPVADGTSGQSLTTNASGQLAFSSILGSYNATAVSVGTAATYTFAAGIPTTAKIVYLTWDDVSTSAASYIRLRVGTSSAFVTSGYLGQHGYVAAGGGTGVGQQRTTDIPIPHTNFSHADNVHSGMLTLTKHTGNKWIYQGVGAVDGENYQGSMYGSVDVGGALNRFEFHLEDNSAVFDAGTVNCTWIS